MKILTSVVNNPTFIEIQYNTLKKFVHFEYEFIVFNDAKKFPDFTNGNNIAIHSQIENICRELHIDCIDIPNESHRTNHCPVVRCADAMNFMLEYMKENIDEYLIIDSDMFLIDYLNIDEYRKNDCAIVIQSRNHYYHIDYLWNGLFYFNMCKMKNIELLKWDKFMDCDVGGSMCEWLKKQSNQIPNVYDIRNKDINYNNNNIYFIKHLWSLTWDISELPENLKKHACLIQYLEEDPRNKNNKYYCEIYDNKFLHYRAGGNWNREGLDLHIYLSEKLKETINKITRTC
jgi:hypothetical protein